MSASGQRVVVVAALALALAGCVDAGEREGATSREGSTDAAADGATGGDAGPSLDATLPFGASADVGPYRVTPLLVELADDDRTYRFEVQVTLLDTLESGPDAPSLGCRVPGMRFFVFGLYGSEGVTQKLKASGSWNDDLERERFECAVLMESSTDAQATHSTRWSVAA